MLVMLMHHELGADPADATAALGKLVESRRMAAGLGHSSNFQDRQQPNAGSSVFVTLITILQNFVN